MNREELIATAKGLAGQQRASSLWGDPEMTIFANEGVDEAARRGRLLVDITTAHDVNNVPVCTFPVTQGAVSITLHPKTLFVRRVKLASQPLPLEKIHLKDLDHVAPDWEQGEQGSVVVWCPNWSPKKLRFYHAFPAADTVGLQIVRLPLVRLVGANDVPELDEEHHMGIVNWMLFRMFAKPDPDTKDKVKAKEYLDLFEQQFGKRSSAVDETWIRDNHGYDEYEGQF